VDQSLGPLPGRESFQLDGSVFRNNIEYDGTGKVTIVPGERVGRIREWMVPLEAVKVEERQIRPFPPWELNAPEIKSTCPPVPDIWRVPMDSDATCENRSISKALLMATTLLLAAIICGLLVQLVG